MSPKSGSGCLTSIFLIVLSAALLFVGKYIPLKYVFVGVTFLALLGWFLTRDARKIEQEKKEREEKEVAAFAEQQRATHRDADSQKEAYRYRCIGHPNVTLAIRYGIANTKKVLKEYGYRATNGEPQCNPAWDNVPIEAEDSILIRKIRRVQKDRFIAELPDFGNRTVVVVIEDGSEAVKTFYPLDDSWFEKHQDLERVLKDNKTFSLHELAKFHVEKTIPVA